MSSIHHYYFVCLQPQKQQVELDLASQYQAFQAWLQTVEASLAQLPSPLHFQYQHTQVLLIWPTTVALLPIVQTIAQLSQHSFIAINQGETIYDAQRQWYYSTIPEQLTAFIEVGKHHQYPLVIGEQASQVLPKEQLMYLTRSYFAGATTALEVYAWV